MYINILKKKFFSKLGRIFYNNKGNKIIKVHDILWELLFFISKRIIIFLIKKKKFNYINYLTDFFISIYGTKKKRKSILILNHERLTIESNFLKKIGYNLVCIKSYWLYHLVTVIFDKNLNKNPIEFYNLKTNNSVEQWRLFSVNFFNWLKKKYGVCLIISPNIHYKNDSLLGGSGFKFNNIPFIVYHKESYFDTKFQDAYWLKMCNFLKNHNFSHIFVESQNMKKLIMRSKMRIDKKKISVFGLKYNNFIKYLERKKKIPKENNKVITFFTYDYHLSYNVDRGATTKLLYTSNKYDNLFKFKNNRGFYILNFIQTLKAFIEYAKNNPDITCIIKYRDNVQHHVSETLFDVIDEYKINIDGIRNLNITSKENPHDLIMKSNIVCGYASTTLFEALIAKKIVVIPFFFKKEIIKKYKDAFHLHIFKYPKLYKVVRNQNEFFNELEKNIKKFDTLNFDNKTPINLFNEYAGLYSSKQEKILKKTIDNIVNHK